MQQCAFQTECLPSMNPWCCGRSFGQETIHITEDWTEDWTEEWTAVHIASAMQLVDLISSGIALTLVKDRFGKGYTIFMDNWYLSPSLFRQLRVIETDAVGTVWLNVRNMPKQLKRKFHKANELLAAPKTKVDGQARSEPFVNIPGKWSIQNKNWPWWERKASCSCLLQQQFGGCGCCWQGSCCLLKQNISGARSGTRSNSAISWTRLLNRYNVFKKDNSRMKLSHLLFWIKQVERLLETYQNPNCVPCRCPLPIHWGSPHGTSHVYPT